MLLRRLQATPHSQADAGLRRRLARLLIIGGISIAAVLGGIVAVFDVLRIDDNIRALLRMEANQIAPFLPNDLDGLDGADKANIESRLQSFLSERSGRTGGRFVVVSLFDRNHHQIADQIDSAIVDLSFRQRLQHYGQPQNDDLWYGQRLVDGQLFLLTSVTLRRPDRHPIGRFEGAYLLPWSTLGGVAASGLKTSGLVIVTVIATTLLLYPVINSLNQGVFKASSRLLAANLTTLSALGSAIAKRDSTTNSHNFRVVLLAVRLAEALDLPGERIQALIKGAFLHDVGKLAIPDSILLKPGKLTEAEYEVMKGHVAHGLDIVTPIAWLADASDVVACHHEWFDGSGYPCGLAEDDIPIVARIFAIVDVFDALTSQRPYKLALSLAETKDLLEQGRGSHFDPKMLDVFLSMASDLYREFAGREDPKLEQELHTVTLRHFASLVHGPVLD